MQDAIRPLAGDVSEWIGGLKRWSNGVGTYILPVKHTNAIPTLRAVDAFSAHTVLMGSSMIATSAATLGKLLSLYQRSWSKHQPSCDLSHVYDKGMHSTCAAITVAKQFAIRKAMTAQQQKRAALLMKMRRYSSTTEILDSAFEGT